MTGAIIGGIGGMIFVCVAALPRWAKQRRTRRTERVIRLMRHTLSNPVQFRPLEAANPYSATILRETDGDVKELCARGFVVIGDLVVQPRNQRAYAVQRALVDGVGTTYAFVTISLLKPGPPSLELESYSEDGHWLTVRTERPRPLIPKAPFAHEQVVAPALGLDAVLDKHRAFAGLDAPDAPMFVRCTTIVDLATELERTHERTTRWRAAQPAEWLLEADLRGILGPTYDTAGSWWQRRLTAPLPKARTRKKA